MIEIHFEGDVTFVEGYDLVEDLFFQNDVHILAYSSLFKADECEHEVTVDQGPFRAVYCKNCGKEL